MFIFLLIYSITSLIINPIDNACLTNINYTNINSSNLNILNANYQSILIYFNPFSYSELWFDFRHINLDERYYDVQIMVNGQISTIRNTSSKASLYSLYVTQLSQINIFVDLSDSYSIFSYLFINTTYITMIQSNVRSPNQFNQFIWKVNVLDEINLPYNLPNLSNFKNYYLVKIQDNTQTNITMARLVQSTNFFTDNLNYWQSYSTFQIPYIPYFSNCKNYGSNIYLTKILQDQNACNLVPISSTQPINPLFYGTTSVSDHCDIELECVYDQNPSVHPQNPYWQTLSTKSLFAYLRKYKINFSQFNMLEPQDQSNYINCQIESSGDNSTNYFPQKVTVDLKYYQVTKQIKQMIQCTVTYQLYSPASTNFSYTLKIEETSLSHTAILIAFGFDNNVYIISFVIIGLISNLENLILGIYHYVTNRKQKKPIKFLVYFKLMKQMFYGAIFAIIPAFFLIFLICIIMVGKFLKFTIYTSTQTPYVFWDNISRFYISDYSSTLATNQRVGRQGLAEIVVGFYLILYLCDYLIAYQYPPQQYDQIEVEGNKIYPKEWLKGKFIIAVIFYINFQLCMIYFAYSQFYSQNIWSFIVATKILQMIMEQLIELFFQDTLPSIPFNLINDLAAYLNTISATDFYDFMFSFLIDVAITMCQKSYFVSLQKLISQFTQKKVQEGTIYLQKLLNDEQQQQEQIVTKQDESQQYGDKVVYIPYNEQDIQFQDKQQNQYNQDSDISDDENEPLYKKQLMILNQKKFQEQSELLQDNKLKQQQQIKNTTFEFTTDISNMALGLIFQPFTILFLWITFNQSNILNLYGIFQGQVTIYLLSAVVIGFFSIINMILIFYIMQNYHHLQIEQSLYQCLKKIASRDTFFWKADAIDPDNDLEPKLKATYQYSLSSQFYFIITLFVASMIFVMIGISTMVTNSYNPFTDIGSILIITFWILLMYCLIQFTKCICYLLNVWDYKKLYPRNCIILNWIIAQKSISIVPIKQMNEKYNQQQSMDSLETSMQLKHEYKPRLQIQIDEAKDIRKAEHLLSNVCLKLQPLFSNEQFREKYARENKLYIRQNILKIISLITQIPQLENEILNYDEQMKIEDDSKHHKLQINNTLKNMLNVWIDQTKKVTESNFNRIVQIEKSLKKCNFCYNNWGIYNGFRGICLRCNQEIRQKKEI